MRWLSSVVNLIAVTTLWRLVYIAASKENLRRIQISFILLESAFHELFCLKFSFKLVTFFWDLCKKTKVNVFSEHSVYGELLLWKANRKPHPSVRMVLVWITFSDLFKVTIIQRQITWKWYNIELYLQWPTNRKSYMIYRTAPFSVTLNDPYPKFQGHTILWRWISQKRYEIQT